MQPTMPIDTQFQPAVFPPEAYAYSTYIRRGLSKAQAKRVVAELKAQGPLLRSSTHQVLTVRIPSSPAGVTWLSIKRLDRSAITDRREVGAVAAALAPGTVVLELLPMAIRLVDTANQYHAFALSQELFSTLIEDGTFLTPPHLGDWRELQAWKESEHPGREAAIVLTGHSSAGSVLLAPASRLFPFGWAEPAIANTSQASRLGATQRPL